MSAVCGAGDWKNAVPVPICEAHPEYTELYFKAWELAFAHIRDIPGMPQTPYMDEAFCDTQIWIWDTCFMSLFCKYARDVFPGVESLKNFYDVLYGNKALAKIIPSEKEPDWTHCIPGEPNEIKIHIADNPPLFAWVEYENALMQGDWSYIEQLLYDKGVLQKHYGWIESLNESVTPRGVFVSTCLIREEAGYRWEGGRSGMDNTPRGRTGEHAYEQRPNNPDMLWIDAICQQALSAAMLSRMFALVGDKENESLWNDRFLEKKRLVNDLYWDAEDGFYYDIDRHTHGFHKVMTMASYWALTAGVATPEQAAAMADRLEDPATFGGKVPFPSLSRSDNDFRPCGEYWRGSVWLPTAYAALAGLKRYGLHRQAHETASQLLQHMYRTYAEFTPHTIWECYSPEECRPATIETGSGGCVRPDFCGWSALGPISVYIEFVLGFHTVDAFRRTVEWAKPPSLKGKVGIKNLRFGPIVTDIEADGGVCRVRTNEAYTLIVNGTSYALAAGDNTFAILSHGVNTPPQ